MKKLFLLAACCSLAGVAIAETPEQTKESAAPPTTQQQKMKDCNAEAKTKKLKGDERKQFMKECLSK